MSNVHSPRNTWIRRFTQGTKKIILVFLVLLLTWTFMAFYYLPPMFLQSYFEQTSISAYTEILSGMVSLLILLLCYLLFGKLIERRTFDEFKFDRSDVFSGIFLGFGLFTLVFVILLLDQQLAIVKASIGVFVILVLIRAFITGIAEEVIFRGILFRKLKDYSGKWPALIISSLIFGLIHILNPGASILSSIAITLTAGLSLGLLYIWRKNLWLPISLHSAWNFTQGGIYGIAVSGHSRKGIFETELKGHELLTGGEFGPEASILTIILFVVFNTFLIWHIAIQQEDTDKNSIDLSGEEVEL